MRVFLSALPFLIFVSQSAFAAVDSTLLRMAPSASTVLTGIDVRKAAGTPAGRHILKETTEDQRVTTLVKLTGLNVSRDIRQLLLIGTGRQASFNSPDAVFAEGGFSTDRLIATSRSKGWLISHYREFTLLVQNAEQTATAIGFPKPDIVVVGDLATVKAALASEFEAAALPPALREQVAEIGASYDLWYATILSGTFLTRQAGDSLPSQLLNSGALQSIVRSSGGLRFGQPDQASLTLVTRSNGDAQLLSALLRFVGGLAHLQSGGSPGVVLAENALSSMQVSVNGSEVRAFSAVSDPQLAETLAAGNDSRR